MDSSVGVEVIGEVDVRSGGLGMCVGEKRLCENGEVEVRSVKKVKSGGEFGGQMKKVAEIVLVLATIGKIRGGNEPTVAEMEMMADARARLAEVCQEFGPKDVFPTDVFGSIIEDLGLSKGKEQNLGFGPPKMSIAEKLKVTKQKMEKSEQFATHSAKYSSQRLQPNIGLSGESRHGVQTFPSEKPSHAPSSIGLQPASRIGSVSASNSTSLPYQLPTSEVRPMASTGLPGSNLGRDVSGMALARAERPHFTLNGKSNGTSYTSQVQANSSRDNTMIPAWTVQQQSSSSAKILSDKNIPAHASVKSGGSDMSQIGLQATSSRPFITQTTSMNPPNLHQHIQQGVKSVQAPSLISSHNEIANIVQKLLQPQVPEQPVWNPPSRDYMNKALPCQLCKHIINEVDNVLVCDACEKGYHLQCLQFHNQKSIPRAEWQCGKCFSLSNGKPLPPKYGRVTRNSTAIKVSSNVTSVHLSVSKNAGTMDVKDTMEKTSSSGNSVVQSAPTGAMDKPNHFAASAQMVDARNIQGNGTISRQGKKVEEHPSASGANDLIKTSGDPVGTVNHFALSGEITDVSSMQGNGSFSCKGKEVEEHPSGYGANNLIKTPGATCGTPDDSEVERSYKEGLDARLNLQPSVKSETVSKMLDHSQNLGQNQNIAQTGLINGSRNSSELCPEANIIKEELGKSRGEEFLEHKTSDVAKEDKDEVAVVNSAQTTGTCTEPTEHGGSVSESLHDVNWIGDILRVADGKTYYSSCSISGVLYKVQDHALFRSNKNILTPFKLQGMWEDTETRSKWVVASRCYFPADLPVAVGRPYAPEIREVYESNHDTMLRAGLIEGACQVLPPRTFMEESERRSRLGKEETDRLHPLFICKWFYDEQKGLFRDVTFNC